MALIFILLILSLTFPSSYTLDFTKFCEDYANQESPILKRCDGFNDCCFENCNGYTITQHYCRATLGIFFSSTVCYCEPPPTPGNFTDSTTTSSTPYPATSSTPYPTTSSIPYLATSSTPYPTTSSTPNLATSTTIPMRTSTESLQTDFTDYCVQVALGGSKLYLCDTFNGCCLRQCKVLGINIDNCSTTNYGFDLKNTTCICFEPTTTSSTLPTASSNLPSTSSDSPTTSTDLPSTSSDLSTTSSDIPTASSDSPTTLTDLPSTSSTLSITSSDSSETSTKTNSGLSLTSKLFILVPIFQAIQKL